MILSRVTKITTSWSSSWSSYALNVALLMIFAALYVVVIVQPKTPVLAIAQYPPLYGGILMLLRTFMQPSIISTVFFAALFALAPLAAFLLVNSAVKNRIGGLLAAMLTAFNPALYQLTLPDTHIYALGIVILPFSIFFLIKTLEKRRVDYAILATLTGILLTLASIELVILYLFVPVSWFIISAAIISFRAKKPLLQRIFTNTQPTDLPKLTVPLLTVIVSTLILTSNFWVSNPFMPLILLLLITGYLGAVSLFTRGMFIHFTVFVAWIMFVFQPFLSMAGTTPVFWNTPFITTFPLILLTASASVILWKQPVTLKKEKVSGEHALLNIDLPSITIQLLVTAILILSLLELFS